MIKFYWNLKENSAYQQVLTIDPIACSPTMSPWDLFVGAKHINNNINFIISYVVLHI